MDRSRVARIERVQEMLRDMRRSELADADRSVHVARIELARVQARSTAAGNELARVVEISVGDLEDRTRMVHAVRARARAAVAEVETREAARRRVASELQSAELELKSVSKLGERMAIEARREADGREQKMLDERASLRWRSA